MKSNKVLIASLLALSIGLFSCGGSQKKETAAEAEKPVVRLAQVFERGVPQIADFTATIQPEVKNSIAPTTPGRIRRIMVDVGSHVVKGQRLVQMDAVNLENYQTNIDNLRKNYNRLLELHEVGGVSGKVPQGSGCVDAPSGRFSGTGGREHSSSAGAHLELRTENCEKGKHAGYRKSSLYSNPWLRAALLFLPGTWLATVPRG